MSRAINLWEPWYVAEYRKWIFKGIVMSEALKEAVITASQKWKSSFNSGDAAGCAACYEENAVMEAKPFGLFTGREAIQGFWQSLVSDGFSDVDYIDPKITVIDDATAVLSSGWKMNKAHGVITRELWVRQEDGSMLLREDYFEALG